MMGHRDDLVDFVRDALVAGRTRSEISTALQASGWTTDEVATALDAFADTAFSPPVPRPRAVVSARDFFIYALMFGALVFASSYLVVLIQLLIDFAFGSLPEYRISRIRWAIAMLIVAGPAYLWLNHREEARVAAAPGRSRSALRRWSVYVALLGAASVFAGNLVWLIYSLLDGDLTLQVLLKALTVAVVAGWVFVQHRSRTEEAP